MAGTSYPSITDDSCMPIERGGRWAVNYSSGDFIAGSLAAELKAAPTGSGRALYITHLTLGIVADSTYNITTDARISILDGSGTVLFGPVQFQANGQTTFSKDFRYPIKAANEKALDISGVCSAGSYQAACFVYAEGFTGDKPLG